MIKINTVLSPKLHHLYPSFDPRLQVFSTRKVDFADIKWVGFDMDHTLCKYKSGPVEKLSFKLALDNMVKIKKYPKDILDFEYDHRFPVRGLVIDKKHGTVLKLNAHRKVTRVCKGRKCLNKTEISKLYQNEVIRLSASRYEVMDTLFHLPSCSLFASFVDWQENTGFCRRIKPDKLYNDISYCIDLCHRDGSLKSEIMSRTWDFVERDVDLPETLERLRLANKRIFLLTNSEWIYTKHIMGFLLGDKLTESKKWYEYFDIVMVDAQKPTFFQKRDRKLKEIKNTDISTPVFAQGGRKTLEEELGSSGNEILYVGDHIYGDIVSTKRASSWQTLLILPELAQEVDFSLRQRYERDWIAKLDRQIEFLSYQKSFFTKVKDSSSEGKIKGEAETRLEILRKDLNILSHELSRVSTKLEHTFNPFWGFVLKEGRHLSIFAEQIRDFACLYTSKVENLLNYSPTHIFQPPEESLPHDKITLI